MILCYLPDLREWLESDKQNCFMNILVSLKTWAAVAALLSVFFVAAES